MKNFNKKISSIENSIRKKDQKKIIKHFFLKLKVMHLII